jgi:hypothetical protein
MTVQCYLHSIAKRAEIIALVDSGATENFLNLSYAKWLRLPIKTLKNPRKLYNVDGTENKAGELQHYTNLEMRMGTTTTKLQFFLSNLGEHKAILGYPWFVAVQPNIDWKRGWIDHTQTTHCPTSPKCTKSDVRTMNEKRALPQNRKKVFYQ